MKTMARNPQLYRSPAHRLAMVAWDGVNTIAVAVGSAAIYFTAYLLLAAVIALAFPEVS